MTDQQDFENLKDDVDTLYQYLNSDIEWNTTEAKGTLADINFNFKNLIRKLPKLV